MSAALRRILRRFRCDEGGAVITEAVIILPLLVWAYVALFVFWDAYRAQNTAVKASYTVADMISRELNPVSCAYMNGIKSVFDYMMDADQHTEIVVSSVTWDEEDQRYRVVWSLARGGAAAQTDTTLQQSIGQLPNMSDGDTAIVVETSVGYSPALQVGVPDFDFRQFVVTRPRRAAAGISTTCAA